MDFIEEECQINLVHEDVVKDVESKMPPEDLLCDVAELFKVFGDSTRARILSALEQHELCVCDIAGLLKMTKSAVSHQLRILRQNKLVKQRRSGKEMYYSLDDDHVEKILAMAMEHICE